MAGGTYQVTSSRESFDEIVNKDTIPVMTDVDIYYATAASGTSAHTESVGAGNFVFTLIDLILKVIVPNSVTFTMSGDTYWDFEGIIYCGGNYVVADAVEAGTIDYTTGIVKLSYWTAGTNVIDVKSLLVENTPRALGGFTTYTAVAPIQPASLTISVTSVTGELLNGSTDFAGVISGDKMRGYVDVETGIIDIEFGELVDDSTLSAEEKAMDWYDANDVVGGYIYVPLAVWLSTGRYNCVAYVYLPLSAEVLGINPIRLPSDGRVPLYRVGDVIVVHHTEETAVPATLTNAQVVDLGRLRLAWVNVYNADESPVDTADYTVDLEAGTVTLDDVSSMVAPLNIVDRIEDMALVDDLQINGTLGITKALSHDYPLGTYVSSALITQDLFARVTNIFEQVAWTGEWSDEVIGDVPLAAFDNTVSPITISNIGGTQERWMVKFTSSTTFEVYGEFSGLVQTGNTSSDCSPYNPAITNPPFPAIAPYFFIPAAGWGGGWSTGNILRFNTIAANKPVWVARTVLQSEAYSGTDQFCIEIRGDIDTP